MKELQLVNGKVSVPEKHQLSPENRRLHIKTPWCTTIQTLPKRGTQVTIRQWFRHKDNGDEPYVPVGTIEINGEKFKVQEEGL